MHIADILSRLAGKDLEPSDQLIPISFNVLTRRNRTPTQPLKLYTADRHKQSQLPPSYVPPHTKSQVTTPKPVQSKTKIIQPHIQKMTHPLRIQTYPPKSTSSKPPPFTCWYFMEIIFNDTSTPQK